MWLRVGRRWLPTWLPKTSLAALVFEWPHTVSRFRVLRFYRDTGPSAPTSCR
jgi:hypothetical protein